MNPRTKNVFKPSAKPQLGARIETITRYIAELEHCLEAANVRVAERRSEIERPGGRLPCPCGACPRLSRCEGGREGGAE
jgi:hypothetical protein